MKRLADGVARWNAEHGVETSQPAWAAGGRRRRLRSDTRSTAASAAVVDGDVGDAESTRGGASRLRRRRP